MAPLLFTWMLGCSSGTSDMHATDGGVDAAVDLGATDGTQSSATIGPSGGSIALGSLILSVPAGAVTNPTVLTITRTDDPIPAGYIGYSAVYRLAPEGTQFAVPLTLVMPFAGDPSLAGLYWTLPNGLPGWQLQAGTVEGSTVVASVSHFSEGFVGTPVTDGGADDVSDATDTDGGNLPDVPATDGGTDASPIDTSVDVPSIDAGVDVAEPPVDTGVDAPSADTGVDVPPMDTGCGGACVGGAFRQLRPSPGAFARNARPTLYWNLPTGVDGAHVTLCRDHALSTGCVSFDATGDHGAPTTALARGLWFWQLHTRSGGVTGSTASATWRVFVGTGTTDGFWGGDHDLNGDGLPDSVLVVSSGIEPVLGSASGPTAVPGSLASPPLSATNFGQNIAWLGDSDGDGYGDFLTTSAGATYVVRGGPTGLSGVGATFSAPTGCTAIPRGIGDINGDGFADAAYQCGSFIYQHLGGLTGLSTTPVRIGPAAGAATVTADLTQRSWGDVDGDGATDVMASDSTSFFYLRGGPSGLDLTRRLALPATTIPVTPYGFLDGACIGDFNGDGIADLGITGGSAILGGSSGFTLTSGSFQNPLVTSIRGASYDDFNNDGYSDVITTNAIESNDTSNTVWYGNLTGVVVAPANVTPGFGTSIYRGTIFGDFDADGHDDMVVNLGSSGAIYRGSAMGLQAGVGVAVTAVPNLIDVATVGDLNHDGHADLLVDISEGTSGEFQLLLGSATGMTLTSTVYTGTSANAAGDVNNDGYADAIAIDFHVLSARLYYGSATGLGATSVLLTLPTTAGDPIDHAVGLGDVNGDGYPDVGASSNSSSGSVGIFLGGPGGIATTPVLIPDPTGTVHVGIFAAGDINHDGLADVLVERVVGGTNVAVAVYFGARTGFPGAVVQSLATSTDEANNNWYAIGDVNGDGYGDVYYNDYATHEILYGSATGLAITSASMLPSGAIALRPAGDLNHDGFGDVLEAPGPFTGSVEINNGSATGPLSAWSNIWGWTHLASVTQTATLGDVDGDGVPDFAIGQGVTSSVQVSYGGRAVPSPTSVPLPVASGGGATNFF